MSVVRFDPRDPVFEALGFAFSFRIVTLADDYGIDPDQTSAREEEADFVVRAAGLIGAGRPQAAAGAVVLRLAPAPGGSLRVRWRAKAPGPIRASKLLLRGLATPLEIVEDGTPRSVAALGETFVFPDRLDSPLLLLRCGGEPLAVRFEDREMREKRFAVAVERSGARAGQGALEIVHVEAERGAEREHVAPPCVLARGGAASGVQAAHLDFARRMLRRTSR